MRKSIALVEFWVGTTAHQPIWSWNCRLRRTTTITLKKRLINNSDGIRTTVQWTQNNKNKIYHNLIWLTYPIYNNWWWFTIVTGKISQCYWLPTYQLDINVAFLSQFRIATTTWYFNKSSSHITGYSNKLQRQLLIDTLDWDIFLKLEWKQLNWYKIDKRVLVVCLAIH